MFMSSLPGNLITFKTKPNIRRCFRLVKHFFEHVQKLVLSGGVRLSGKKPGLLCDRFSDSKWTAATLLNRVAPRSRQSPLHRCPTSLSLADSATIPPVVWFFQ